MLDDTESIPETAGTLPYATPDHRRRTGGGAAAVVTITLFVCIASVTIFALVIHEHQEPWTAAAAVTALSVMGGCCAFFLTRR
jgi:hypothetical protein